MAGAGRRVVLALAVVDSAALIFLIAIVLLPWVEVVIEPQAALLRIAWSPLCHQLPERSVDLGFGPLAVCARCTGLYLGGVLGLVAGTLRCAQSGRAPCPSWRWAAAAAAPTLADVGAGWLGLGELTSWPRLVVAIAPGLVCGLALAAGVADLARSRTGQIEPEAMPPLPSGCVQSSARQGSNE